jgi:hypothetical protein
MAKGGKDRSFAAKMAKADKGAAEQTATALVIRPFKSGNGHYKFKRVLAKLTKENKEALGV